jgi:hypothetical protein
MQQVWRCQEFGIFQSAVHKGQRVSMQRRRPQSLSPGNIGRYSLATIKGCQRSRTALHPHAQVHLTAPAIHPPCTQQSFYSFFLLSLSISLLLSPLLCSLFPLCCFPACTLQKRFAVRARNFRENKKLTAPVPPTSAHAEVRVPVCWSHYKNNKKCPHDTRLEVNESTVILCFCRKEN